jgi:hypothetical protein
LRPLGLRFFLRVLRLVFFLGFLGIKSTASWLLLISIEPSIIQYDLIIILYNM